MASEYCSSSCITAHGHARPKALAVDGLSLLCRHLCSVLTAHFSCSFAYEESVDEVRRVMEKYGPVDSIDMKTGEDEHALRNSHITDNPAPDHPTSLVLTQRHCAGAAQQCST